MSMDLRQAEISIEIDDQVRASGVEITLEHEAPVLASPSTDHRKEDGAAFKLQFLSYNFVWDNVEMVG